MSEQQWVLVKVHWELGSRVLPVVTLHASFCNLRCRCRCTGSSKARGLPVATKMMKIRRKVRTVSRSQPEPLSKPGSSLLVPPTPAAKPVLSAAHVRQLVRRAQGMSLHCICREVAQVYFTRKLPAA